MQCIAEERERSKFLARLVEMETRNYYQTKKELEKLKTIDCLPPSSASILYMERTVHAIERALIDTGRSSDGENRLKMIHLKYWDGRLTDEGIMMRIPVGRTTFYKWRKDYVVSVGQYLGYQI